MKQEQTSVIKEEVPEDFKKNVAQLDAAGIFDEIVTEIVKVVEADEGFKAFVTEEEAKNGRQKETAGIEPAVAAK